MIYTLLNFNPNINDMKIHTDLPLPSINQLFIVLFFINLFFTHFDSLDPLIILFFIEHLAFLWWIWWFLLSILLR